jgi:glyoxylase-like metal-dependent hydrolase (beta-lactamase superfamily II)
VSDEETTLVYVADLLPTRHHLAPTWTMAYDVRPLQTIEEKGDFLKRAVAEDWNLFFEHDPEVSLGSLEETEHGIQVDNPRCLDEL